MRKRIAAVVVFFTAICALALSCGCQTAKPVDDAAIAKSVKAKLATVFGPIEDRQTRQFDRGANGETITYISVSSVGGVVTLTGEVGSKKDKAKAGEIARGVPHVVRVNNNLSMAPGYSDDAVNDKP
jgi:BON domain-containing protein